MLVALSGPILPFELAERIIITAWCTLSPPKASTYASTRTSRYLHYRAQFMAQASAVSTMWRNILADAAFRYVVVWTQGDVELYERLVSRTLRAAAVAPAAAAVAHRALFKRSHVTLHLHNLHFYGESRELGAVELMTSPSPSRTAYSLAIPPIADGCTVEVHGADGNLAWLAQCQFTTDVILHCSLRPASCIPPSVRHIRHHNFAGGSGEILQLIESLPHITHLTVDYYRPLKAITTATPHPRLWCLTLDSPPHARGATVLSPWCINTALNAGLLRRGQGTASTERRMIIVQGASKIVPQEWQQALTACERHNVELKHVVAY